MSPEWAGFAGILIMFALMSLRTPVGVAMLVGAGIGYSLMDGWYRAFLVASSIPKELGTEYTLSVVPLFVAMGAFASRMGFSERLFAGTSAIFAGVRGSSGMATIGASAMFGAICGSSLATTATIGKIAIPEMRKRGYPDSLIAGTVASGGTLGILIPPSIILAIYGLIAEQSISRLFAGALIPGLVLTTLYLITTYLLAKRQSTSVDISAAGNRFQAIVGMWEIAVIFGISIGGLYAGFFTPTEAAAVGACTALALGLLNRRLNFVAIQSAVMETLITTSVLFFIALGASLFAFFIVQSRIPMTMVDFVQAIDVSPQLVMFIIILFYLVAGMFLEGIGMVLATVPVFFPLVVSLGYDPIWFGVMVVVLVEIGLIHPPVGMNLFVIKNQAKDMSLTEIYKGILPYLAAQFLMVALLLFWPAIVTFLPAVLYG